GNKQNLIIITDSNRRRYDCHLTFRPQHTRPIFKAATVNGLLPSVLNVVRNGGRRKSRHIKTDSLGKRNKANTSSNINITAASEMSAIAKGHANPVCANMRPVACSFWVTSLKYCNFTLSGCYNHLVRQTASSTCSHRP